MSHNHDDVPSDTPSDSEQIGQTEETPWPEQAFPLDEVREWIASALPLSGTRSARVVTVYAAYRDTPDQRVTARFALADQNGGTQEIVFKGNRFPLLAGSARAHALLSRHCPGRVPHVLAWDEYHASHASRLLYQPFEGNAVEDGEPLLLVETARTLAAIQDAIDVSGEIEAIGLPRLTEREILPAFDSVRAHVAAHFSAWQTDEEGKLSRRLGFPSESVVDVLDAARPHIERCAEQVASLGLAPTIDHGDLHGGNAVLQADGSILIYDWETATVGCPLFSVEKLLVAAWRRDAKPVSGGPWGYMPHTPTQALVRDAYRKALDTGGTKISDAVFDAAMSLAVVKEMHAEIVWANLLGWQDGNPEWTAQLIRRLRHRL